MASFCPRISWQFNPALSLSLIPMGPWSRSFVVLQQSRPTTDSMIVHVILANVCHVIVTHIRSGHECLEYFPDQRVKGGLCVVFVYYLVQTDYTELQMQKQVTTPIHKKFGHFVKHK